MTRKELKKEAEEKASIYFDKLHKDNGNVSDTPFSAYDVFVAYEKGALEFAEPREKRIADLEAQIEKMKCCSNCNHFNKESDIEYCQNCERQLVNSLDNFPREEIIKDEWEVRR